MSRSHAGGSDRIVAEPGPVEGEDCDDCPDDDPEAAVYRIPDPRWSIGAVSALCPFHLAAIKREHASFWGRLVHESEYGDVEEHVEDGALVERADLPEELPHDGTIYRRFGLDDTGRAYFVAATNTGYELVETDSEFEVLETTLVARGRLLGLLDHVSDDVGWRGLASEWVDRAYAEDSGGEGA